MRSRDVLATIRFGDLVSPLKTTTREQDAVRLLMLLRHVGEDDLPPEAPPASVRWISGEQRLQAMDFWLRNPDYLADELLDIAADGRPDLVTAARRIVLD